MCTKRDYEYYSGKIDCMVYCYEKGKYDEIRGVIREIKNENVNNTDLKNEFLMYFDEYRVRESYYKDTYISKYFMTIIAAVIVTLFNLLDETGSLLLNMMRMDICAVISPDFAGAVFAALVTFCIMLKLGLKEWRDKEKLSEKLDFIENQIKYLID